MLSGWQSGCHGFPKSILYMLDMVGGQRNGRGAFAELFLIRAQLLLLEPTNKKVRIFKRLPFT